MEWNMEETFSKEWKIFSMEWQNIACMEYGKIVFHSMPCYSFIHRHLLFGVALCGNINPTYLTKLQRVQNKAVRIITNSKLRSSILIHV